MAEEGKNGVIGQIREQLGFIITAVLVGNFVLVFNNSLDLRELKTRFSSMESNMVIRMSDRYRGKDAERDFSVVNQRLEALERRPN